MILVMFSFLDSNPDPMDTTDKEGGINNTMKLVIILTVTALVILIMIIPIRLIILSWRRRQSRRQDELGEDSIGLDKSAVGNKDSGADQPATRAQSPEEKQQMQRLFNSSAYEAPIQRLEDIEEWTLELSGFEMSLFR